MAKQNPLEILKKKVSKGSTAGKLRDHWSKREAQIEEATSVTKKKKS